MFFHRLAERINRIGSGKIIAFVGPDGSGKSTVINALAVGLFAEKMYMGDWGFRLQPLYNWMHKRPLPVARVTYLFFYIENWFRYLKAFGLKMAGKTVLIDRWPGLNRHLRRKNIWLRLNDLMYKPFPRADKYVFVSAPAPTIHARKQELSVEEIIKSQENIRERLEGFNYKEIVNDDLDQCLNETLAFLLTKQKQV